MLINNKIIRNTGTAALLALALWQWGQAGIITGKAYLAKWLIAQAWQQTLLTGENTKPWPWADTWPVAQVSFSSNNNTSFYVLAGSAGNSLAFGPGHVTATALPGTDGASVIGGHRDTHFALLQHSKKDDIITVQNQQGISSDYKITTSWVADSNKQPLFIDTQQNSLHLITCYPFNALTPGGSERFVVRAELAI